MRFYNYILTVNEIADVFEAEEDITGEDSGSDKDWSPAHDQDDLESDDQPKNNKQDQIMTAGSKGNQAVVQEESEVRVYMDPPVEYTNRDTDRDSDDSDQPYNLVQHFPRHSQGSGSQLRKSGRTLEDGSRG